MKAHRRKNSNYRVPTVGWQTIHRVVRVSFGGAGSGKADFWHEQEGSALMWDFYQVSQNTITSKQTSECCLWYIYPQTGGSHTKETSRNVGNLGLVLGLGRSPGGGHGNPLQDSCLENPMDRGAWQATVHGLTKNGTRLSIAQHSTLRQAAR